MDVEQHWRGESASLLALRRSVNAGVLEILPDGAQRSRASENLAPAGISSGGRPEAASRRPLKLKKEVRAVISQMARSLQPAFRRRPMSSSFTRLGVSVSLLA